MVSHTEGSSGKHSKARSIKVKCPLCEQWVGIELTWQRENSQGFRINDVTNDGMGIKCLY